MDKKVLGRRLRAHREAVRLTQEEVSSRSSKDGEQIAVGSISDWERGVRVPGLDKLQRLARIYGVTLDELVSGKPGEKRASAQDEMRRMVRLATQMLEEATRQRDPGEAQRRATEALGVLRLAEKGAA